MFVTTEITFTESIQVWMKRKHLCHRFFLGNKTYKKTLILNSEQRRQEHQNTVLINL